jgi:hypothetical protein
LMAAVHSKGGGVEVNGGSTTMIKSLRKRMAAARSEAEVKAAACFRAGDEAAVCFRARIKDGRWRQRRGGF